MATKSIIYIQITAPLNPSSNNPKSGDWLALNLELEGNANLTQIHEAPTINRTVQGCYRNISNDVKDSATKCASKMSQDWKNVGGTNNVKVTYVSNPPSLPAGHYIVVELQSTLWRFDGATGTAISNGKAVVRSLSNAPLPVPKTVTLTQTDTVDCSNKRINYDIVITGGTPPYAIQGTATGTVSNTDGTHTIQLTRGLATNIIVRDSLNVEIGRKLITAPIFLETGHFNVTVSQDGASPLAVVAANVVLPNTLFPITYSLDDVNYQSSGNFPDLDFSETYTIYIKDKFGCKISKTFVTPEELEEVTQDEQLDRVLQISNAGTLSWKELVDFSATVKKNFTNTLSCEELSVLAYSYTHEFDSGDFIAQQFKSSYDFHKISLLTDNGSSLLTEVMQSQNLRLVEKVDCKLFRGPDGELCIYFRNGNSYIEGTTTVNGSSDYDDVNLPTWARQGEKIKVDGVGTVTIKRIKSDSTRGLFIQTGAGYSSLTDDNGFVQANYNRQNYNTYEFGFNMSAIQKTGRIIIEAGFNGLVERTFVSERIKKITDSNAYYLLQWADPENKSNIVHQTGITHFARLRASLIFLTKSNSETDRSDSATINLNQEAYRTANFKVAVQGHGMENKLHLASGMEYFQINGISYRKIKFESEPQGASNYYIIEGEFETGGNLLGVKSDELVLKEPLTGVTNKPSIPATIPTALAFGEGMLVLNGAGGLILVSDS